MIPKLLNPIGQATALCQATGQVFERLRQIAWLRVVALMALMLWGGTASAQIAPANQGNTPDPIASTQLDQSNQSEQKKSANSPIDKNAALLEKYAQLSGSLASNAYGRPLFLESLETASTVNGDVYAVLNSPYATVSNKFKNEHNWCEVMILPINTKYCHETSVGGRPGLRVHIGKKTEQDLADTFGLDFNFNVTAASPKFVAVQLNAIKGPLGTHHYKIELSALPLPDGKTYMHLHYEYSYGFTSRLAMQAYLATVGNGKVGFTRLNGTYVDGMRGAVERNTMRYYLAIDAYLANMASPAAQQFDGRLEYWFTATQKYPAQFGDIEKSAYLTMKKNEYQRQQTSPGS